MTTEREWALSQGYPLNEEMGCYERKVPGGTVSITPMLGEWCVTSWADLDDEPKEEGWFPTIGEAVDCGDAIEEL